jgi:hypothetical protein
MNNDKTILRPEGSGIESGIGYVRVEEGQLHRDFGDKLALMASATGT